MKNRIYFFTGTGNSLWLAKEIAKQLPGCDLVAIKSGMDMNVPEGLERVGFVYPTYGWASPLIVADFFRRAHFPKQGGTYYFAVSTCGGLAVNVIRQAGALLAERGVHLNYGKGMAMFKNSVINYNMGKNPEQSAQAAAKRALPIISAVVNKTEKRIKPVNKALYKLHLGFMKAIPGTGADYNVNADCTACGLCEKLCPVKNITMENGKPVFGKACERCVACIQHCPKKAINYLDKTQTRGRYVHPEVNASEMLKY